MSQFFTTPHLRMLLEAEGKVLLNAIYHYWQNRTIPGELFEFIDKLELQFTDGYRLVLGTDEFEDDAMLVFPAFDAEATSLRLMHEFNGKISLRPELGNTQALWENCIGQKLRKVRLKKDSDECYLSNDVLLDFGAEQLEIHPGLEGIVIEPYEEV
ncbi:MAG: hypothetical protein ACRCYO_03505 [Bacteroidia bacterium]